MSKPSTTTYPSKIANHLVREREKEIIRLKTLLGNICYELEGIVRTTEKIGITKNTGYVLSQHNIDLLKEIILKIDKENKEYYGKQ